MTVDERTFRNELMALLPRLRRFATALAGNREAAEDLLQSTIERTLRNWKRFEADRRLDSWVYKIMQNIWLDTKRASIRLPLYTDEPLDAVGEDGRAVMESRQELQRVREAFGRLPDEQRSVMTLVALEGFSYAEAATALGAPIGTVMSRIARARASLAAQVRAPATPTQVRKEI